MIWLVKLLLLCALPWKPAGDTAGRLSTCRDDQWALHIRLEGGWSASFPDTQMSDTPYVLPDGRVVTRLTKYNATYMRFFPTDDRLVMLKEGKVWWSRSPGLSGPRLAAAGEGDGGLWLDSDGRHLWIRVHTRVGLLDLATGDQVEITRDRVERELGNPEADVPTLLRLAHHHQLVPPTPLMEHPKAGFLGLGWKGRTGDSEAREALVRAVERKREGALEGLALLGADAVGPAMLKTMLNEPYAWAWEAAWDRLGPDGKPILLEALTQVSATGEDPARGLIAHVEADGNCWDPLLRLARLKCKGAAYSLTTLAVPDRDKRLLDLLEHEEAATPASDAVHEFYDFTRASGDQSLKETIVDYFCYQRFPAVCPQAVAALKKHPRDWRWVQVLRNQTGVDFGLDRAAWVRWLAQGVGRPPEVQVPLLTELREPTALLLQAQQGRWDLTRVPRLQAVWPVASRLSSDGRVLVHPVWSGRESLAHGQPQAWEARSGKVLTDEYPLTEDLRFGWDAPAGCVRDHRLGRKADWPGNVLTGFPSLGHYDFLKGNDLFHFDPSSFRFYPFVGDWLAGSPTRTEMVLSSPEGMELYDWKAGRRLFRSKSSALVLNWLSLRADFSRDGDWILIDRGDSWTVLNRQGRQLFGGQGQHPVLSPDRTRVVSFGKDTLRVTRLQDGARREVAWSPADPMAKLLDKRLVSFVNGSRELVVDHGAYACVLDASDLKERARFWRFGDLQSVTADGQRWSRSDYRDTTWIWRRESAVPKVYAEQQPLLCELWTGMQLRAGRACPLTPAEYQERVERWRADCGVSWYDGAK
ncbi:hypothetical protein IV102_35850 [bacterium]|nr:hypothetical protein [bacterium]